MTRWNKWSLFLLRVAMGWLFLYAGWAKVTNPEWSAAGYLGSAKTFPELFQWFAQPENISWVNLLNMWGLTAIGVSLISGALVKFSSIAGALMMLLYYLPVLTFPTVDRSYLVDDHVIYALVFAVLATFNAGEIWGLDAWLKKRLKI